MAVDGLGPTRGLSAGAAVAAPASGRSAAGGMLGVFAQLLRGTPVTEEATPTSPAPGGESPALTPPAAEEAPTAEGVLATATDTPPAAQTLLGTPLAAAEPASLPTADSQSPLGTATATATATAAATSLLPEATPGAVPGNPLPTSATSAPDGLPKGATVAAASPSAPASAAPLAGTPAAPSTASLAAAPAPSPAVAAAPSAQSTALPAAAISSAEWMATLRHQGAHKAAGNATPGAASSRQSGLDPALLNPATLLAQAPTTPAAALASAAESAPAWQTLRPLRTHVVGAVDLSAPLRLGAELVPVDGLPGLQTVVREALPPVSVPSALPLAMADTRQPQWTQGLAQDLALVQQQGQSQLRIVLSPEHLGHLQCTLLDSGAGLELRITTETPAARDLLLAQGQDLRDRLSSAGLQLSGFSCESGADQSRRPPAQTALTDSAHPAANDEILTTDPAVSAPSRHALDLYA